MTALHKPFTCPTCDQGESHHLPPADQGDDPWCAECMNPWPCPDYLAEQETARLTTEPVTTDPDGTDNSDILHIPYPPSDPMLWVRSPEDAAR